MVVMILHLTTLFSFSFFFSFLFSSFFLLNRIIFLVSKKERKRKGKGKEKKSMTFKPRPPEKKVTAIFFTYLPTYLQFSFWYEMIPYCLFPQILESRMYLSLYLLPIST